MLWMPMSSPQMTRMLGFFGCAYAAPPEDIVRIVTSESASTPVRPSVIAMCPPARASARLDRARRPRRELGGGHGRPLLHGVLGVAPLPLGRRLDRPAPDPLVDPFAEQLARLRIGHLRFRLRPTDEGIGPGGEVLERAKRPRLRDDHG